MERDELLRLMADLESDRVERTTSTTNTDKFAQAICAFANDLAQHQQPGVLFVGVDDKSGHPAGIEVTDRLLQNLAAIRSDGNVQPIPTISVAKHSMPGGDVAVVEVTPSDLPPVRYKGQVWIRVGPRRGIASEQEERILTERRVAQARTWDARPCFDATLEDHRNYEGSSTPVSIRQFDDRIEILSPGGLFGDLTREQFPHGTSYRNPILAEAAKTLGFVNRYGRGISIAQSELAKNDSPPARFEPASNYFLVILAERP